MYYVSDNSGGSCEGLSEVTLCNTGSQDTESCESKPEWIELLKALCGKGAQVFMHGSAILFKKIKVIPN